MRRYYIFAIIFIMALTACVCQIKASETARDPNHLFYSANALYEKQEYAKAVEEYLKILDASLESGELYYNIGNGFFKLGKLGYAILCYKKAEKFMPGDSDLRSNLAYAQSLTENSAAVKPEQWIVVRLIELPFRDLDLTKFAKLLIALYLVSIFFSAANILFPVVMRKARSVFFIVLACLALTLIVFSIRYYDEEMVRRGIVIAKEVECKYEPIDKSTTYYVLKEGQEVVVVKTKNGWKQVRRTDGKLAWVKTDAVEEF